jgi:hypothetical protein
VSIAQSFDIEAPANISTDSSKIRCEIFNKVSNESSTLSSTLIGNRFLHLAETPVIYLKIQEREKSNLELMEELGLLGAIEDTEITSENRKEFIRKSLKKRYGKKT